MPAVIADPGTAALPAIGPPNRLLGTTCVPPYDGFAFVPQVIESLAAAAT